MLFAQCNRDLILPWVTFGTEKTLHFLEVRRVCPGKPHCGPADVCESKTMEKKLRHWTSGFV